MSSTPFVLDDPLYSPTMNQTSSERLQVLKKLRGIRDARELSTLTGINISTVRSNLNGSRPISKAKAPVYCAKLRVRVDWLLYGAGPGPDAATPAPGALTVGVGVLKPTFVVASSEAKVSPDGKSKGVELTMATGESIVLAVDRQALAELLQALKELESIFGALAG